MSQDSRLSNLPEIEKYVGNSNHYYNNSQILLNKEEYAKAGELLWGSIVEASKALRLKYTGEPIGDHKKVRSFLNELCLKNDNLQSCIDWNKASESLHINFYETFMEKEEFLEAYEKGKLLLAFIKGLAFRISNI